MSQLSSKLLNKQAVHRLSSSAGSTAVERSLWHWIVHEIKVSIMCHHLKMIV